MDSGQRKDRRTGKGDTDTIAAMAGAISGAYLGIEAIPADWRERLENRVYIETLAHKLWQLVKGQATLC